jgi:hypothetical protein
MDLLLRIASNGRSLTFDSGGPLVELGDLAKQIAEQIQDVEIARSELISEHEDSYFPRSHEYENLCKEFGIEPLKLNEMVEITINNHRKLLEI